MEPIAIEHSDLLKSSACSQAQLQSDKFQTWAERMTGQRIWKHRKMWEWCFVAQALHERGFLTAGKRGLGFAVGQEPLPALFASYGCDVLATDLGMENEHSQAWADTSQHASSIEQLRKPLVCSDPDFESHVQFRFMDMNHIDPDLTGFDFVWSCCSLEHLGSLEQGMLFVHNSLRCLRPGGIAVHTTEHNVSSDDATLETGPGVLYRRQDFGELARQLRSEGHSIDLDFTLGTQELDVYVDRPPYEQKVHLRLEIGGYVCTSFGLIVQKASDSQ